MNAESIGLLLDQYPGAGRDQLIPILQDIQERYGYLSKEAVVVISRRLNIPSSKIYGVATFYNQFRFLAPGKYHVQLCRGTACHVKGSAALLEEVKKELKVGPGQTTPDGLFSLEVVACIGACGLSPVISVNGEFHAKVKTGGVKRIFDQYRAREKGN
ncbi:MAG TPA: NAD(P)H-dependent oxidoreductase subunit E [Elusimicrobiota bacterium]|nr:NAD(P)H-dependent oxidoreductase subunit E [Elusimicrobiota bacterium]